MFPEYKFSSRQFYLLSIYLKIKPYFFLHITNYFFIAEHLIEKKREAHHGKCQLNLNAHTEKNAIYSKKKNSAIASNVWHLPVEAEDWNEKSIRVGKKHCFERFPGNQKEVVFVVWIQFATLIFTKWSASSSDRLHHS